MTSISSISSLCICSRTAAVIFLPAWRISSRLPRGVLGAVDGLAELQAHQVVGDLPEELALADLDAVHLVEGLRISSASVLMPMARRKTVARNLRLRSMRTWSRFLESYSNSTQLPRYGMICAAKSPFSGWEKKTPGRAVELADDDALGAVDDEGPVLGHQRDVAEVDLLLLDVADGLGAGLRVLVPDHEADRDLQGNREGHAPLLALVDVVLELQADGLVAGVAGGGLVLVEVAALRAVDLAVAAGVGDEGGAAEAAGAAQLVEAHHAGRTCIPSCRWSTRRTPGSSSPGGP